MSTPTTQIKTDFAGYIALSSGGLAWLDVLQSALEWGVLIMGFVSGGFALYWNIRKWRSENDKQSN